MGFVAGTCREPKPAFPKSCAGRLADSPLPALAFCGTISTKMLA